MATCSACGRPEETYDFSSAAMTIHDALVHAITDLQRNKGQRVDHCDIRVQDLRKLAMAEGTTILDLAFPVELIPVYSDRLELGLVELYGRGISNLLAIVKFPFNKKEVK
jgi:hypothetical protein